MGSELGIAKEKIDALPSYAESPLFNSAERLALEYADRMTFTDKDVSDDFFRQLRSVYSEDEVVELTAIIAWENSSSKFNRALRVPSQQLWERYRNKKGL